MSVAQQLGLEVPYGDLMICAGERWGHWQSSHPVLRVCEDLFSLRDWVWHAEPNDANEVLLALGELGAVDGGDDPAATTALLWLLLPGAVGIARSLQSLSNRIDELVAAQLWICARTLSWAKDIRVAATVLKNTRREVLTDLGVGHDAKAARTESASSDLDLVLAMAGPSAYMVGHTPANDHWTAEADLLYGLLQDATNAGVVSSQDCDLLLQLAEHADTTRNGRGRAGLIGRTSAAQVAHAHGLSRATIARRADRALNALRYAYAAADVAAA